MGFSAMKLINEAGIGGAAVISVVQPSARSLSPPAMRAWAPLMRQLSPGGPKARLGCWPWVYFLPENFPEPALVH